MKPIIALWSHPRSMSTAMERVMRARGDLDCAHEPFMYDYYVARRVRAMPHFEVEPDHPTSYRGIRDMLLARAERQAVFFKDMSYYVVPQIFDDPDFCTRLTNCFLIRDPLASIVSYHKLDPELTLEEIGLEAQWRHFEALRATSGVTPPVVEAEAVRVDPKGVIGALWRAIGLEHREDAFDWDDDKTPQDWAQVGGWHGEVATSSGIRALSQEEREAQKARFDALAAAHPHLRAFWEHHRPFYEKLKAQAIRPT